MGRYSETIDMIYKEHIFDFDRLDAVIAFTQIVIQPRLDRIRVLTLHHTFKDPIYIISPPSSLESYSGTLKNPRLSQPDDADTWEELCACLSSRFPRLEELYMHLGAPVGDEYLCLFNAHLIFLALCQIRQPKVFEISVPRRPGPLEYPIDDMPFTLICREGR
jgi:hypothetical protein